jgi:hypothetical protein
MLAALLQPQDVQKRAPRNKLQPVAMDVCWVANRRHKPHNSPNIQIIYTTEKWFTHAQKLHLSEGQKSAKVDELSQQTNESSAVISVVGVREQEVLQKQ